MISLKFIKNKSNLTSISLCSIFIFNLRNHLFPTNFQQDDVAELEPIFFDRLICAFEWGDQHPLFSSIICYLHEFLSGQIFISGIIILFALLTITLFLTEKLFNFNLALLINFTTFNTYGNQNNIILKFSHCFFMVFPKL